MVERDHFDALTSRPAGTVTTMHSYQSDVQDMLFSQDRPGEPQELRFETGSTMWVP